jgi:hypothetical protein
LRKRASEADTKLKRLYDMIENGIADLAAPMLKDQIAEFTAVRDQARVDAERAQDATPQALKTLARQARSLSASKSMRKKFASWGPRA